MFKTARLVTNTVQVIWSNLKIKWWERVIRQIVIIGFVVALIIFWSVPVAVVGAISNINYLTCILPWLDFINDIPKVILGVVTGLLPTILLAVLMALLPIILRLAAKIQGDPTASAVELSVQNFYFAFQIIQVFLVATLGSAASSVVQKVTQDPTSVTNILAENLPKASNFYLSYFILQGLAIVSSLLLGLVGLILVSLIRFAMDCTDMLMVCSSCSSERSSIRLHGRCISAGSHFLASAGVHSSPSTPTCSSLPSATPQLRLWSWDSPPSACSYSTLLTGTTSSSCPMPSLTRRAWSTREPSSTCSSAFTSPR